MSCSHESRRLGSYLDRSGHQTSSMRADLPDRYALSIRYALSSNLFDGLVAALFHRWQLDAGVSHCTDRAAASSQVAPTASHSATRRHQFSGPWLRELSRVRLRHRLQLYQVDWVQLLGCRHLRLRLRLSHIRRRRGSRLGRRRRRWGWIVSR